MTALGGFPSRAVIVYRQKERQMISRPFSLQSEKGRIPRFLALSTSKNFLGMLTSTLQTMGVSFFPVRFLPIRENSDFSTHIILISQRCLHFQRYKSLGRVEFLGQSIAQANAVQYESSISKK